MYKKIVVPLDGSKLAESTLPHLEEIARACNVPEIVLVSVTERIKGHVPDLQKFENPQAKEYASSQLQVGTNQTGVVYSTNAERPQDMTVYMGRMARTADAYLHKISKQLEKDGLKVSVNVLAGNPAEEIVRYAEMEHADLIIIASRGKSGFSRWDMGNVAEKVVRATKVAVLLVKPGPDFVETKAKRKGEIG
jgi:nucleotide-binding universal stress UspA family protein